MNWRVNEGHARRFGDRLPPTNDSPADGPEDEEAARTADQLVRRPAFIWLLGTAAAGSLITPLVDGWKAVPYIGASAVVMAALYLWWEKRWHLQMVAALAFGVLTIFTCGAAAFVFSRPVQDEDSTAKSSESNTSSTTTTSTSTSTTSPLLVDPKVLGTAEYSTCSALVADLLRAVEGMSDDERTALLGGDA